MEIWKTIEGFEDYEVSNFGRVKSLKKQKIIKSSITPDGYCYLNLVKNKKQFTFRVHRLVAIAFIFNTEKKPTVNHINGIKTDNKTKNLEWATRKEQSEHCLTLGLYNPFKRKVICTETNIIFDSAISAAKYYNINKTTLTAKLNGNRKNNTKLRYA